MKKIKRIFAILLLLCLINSAGCKEDLLADDADIISVVDAAEGYVSVDILAFADNDSKGTEIKKVYKNQNKLVINTMTQGGYNGAVELVILLDEYKISDIKAINIKETEGIGTKAFKENFLSQFKALDISKSHKLAGGGRPSQSTDIIYVTGATYTSNTVIAAINAIIEWYEKNSAALNAA